MLSEHTIQIVQSTVPILQQRGTDITKRFYQMMFDGHPELLNVFNHANQKQGRQQTALASAVLAAATHIDNLGAILPAVKQIAHKHRSLGIRPEQYPIVGHYLLAAIQDVLGDAATEDVLGAWAEAYGAIADAFIGVERELYREAETQSGGWAGFRAFRVVRKVRESDVITSFYLMPEDGGAVAVFRPGQYVSVKMEIPGEANTHIRQYSLSGAPNRPYYRISVKREDEPGKPEGKVSVYLHRWIEEGDRLWLSAPAGEFTLEREDERPVVLISGGVGLTPLISMLADLAVSQPQRQVTFIHAARNSKVHALRAQVEELAAKHPQISAFWCYDQPTEQDRLARNYDKEGHIDLPWLQQIVPTKDAGFYFCGPVPFMAAVNRMLTEWGVAEADIHYEFFGPSGSLVSA
jgi:nitric oxide dioxygenase